VVESQPMSRGPHRTVRQARFPETWSAFAASSGEAYGRHHFSKKSARPVDEIANVTEERVAVAAPAGTHVIFPYVVESFRKSE
jgi:hypothetical protein